MFRDDDQFAAEGTEDIQYGAQPRVISVEHLCICHPVFAGGAAQVHRRQAVSCHEVGDAAQVVVVERQFAASFFYRWVGGGTRLLGFICHSW